MFPLDGPAFGMSVPDAMTVVIVSTDVPSGDVRVVVSTSVVRTVEVWNRIETDVGWRINREESGTAEKVDELEELLCELERDGVTEGL